MPSKDVSLEPSWIDHDGPPAMAVALSGIPTLVAAINALPEALLSKGERLLEHEIRKRSEQRIFPRQLGLLKIRFWEEYRLAAKEKRRMRIEDVMHGICVNEYWQKNVVRNPENLAWLIMPPVDEVVAQKEIIQLGMKRLRDVFDLPVYVKKKDVDTDSGKVKTDLVPNIPLIREMHAIVKTMQDRLEGSVIQRQEKKVAKIIRADIHNLPPPPGGPAIPAPDVSSIEETTTLEELDVWHQKLQEMSQAVQTAQRNLRAEEKASKKAPKPAPDETPNSIVIDGVIYDGD